MAAARPSTKKDSGDSPELVSYRLLLVENAVRDLTTKFDKQDNIKKADLNDLKATVISTITDIKVDFNDKLKKLDEDKASSQELRDFKKQIAGWGALGAALIVASYSYFLTRLH